jgi:SAM-dependent MidA family methyltransferase
MTALLDLIRSRIDLTGPMPLSEYMTTCLLHPKHGYYTTRDPLGAKGDFTTAPEISQMYGEMVGLCLAQSWLDQGSPAKITLAELGPGRGSLMADILRATKGVPGFHDAVHLHLVEASPALQHAQAARLAGYNPTWHAHAGELPDDVPLYLVANEFFDALPIRQFQRDGDAWREILVTTSDTGLTRGLSDAAPIDALANRLEDTKDGDLVETCAPAQAIAAQIGERIAAQGGLALIIDYGDWRSQGDTFQALRRHEFADPLEHPGQADLTAHVDFEAIAIAAQPAKYTRLTGQGLFLERLGITARAQALATRLTGTPLENHIAAHRRLTHPEEMGTLFKVLGITPETAPAPAGLSA